MYKFILLVNGLRFSSYAAAQLLVLPRHALCSAFLKSALRSFTSYGGRLHLKLQYREWISMVWGTVPYSYKTEAPCSSICSVSSVYRVRCKSDYGRTYLRALLFARVNSAESQPASILTQLVGVAALSGATHPSPHPLLSCSVTFLVSLLVTNRASPCPSPLP